MNEKKEKRVENIQTDKRLQFNLLERNRRIQEEEDLKMKN